MAFGIDYTPEHDVSPWGNASESKSETRSSKHSFSKSSSWSGWNKWQEMLGSPWTQLARTGIGQVENAYAWAPEQLKRVAQNVINWNTAPPVEYTAGRDALLSAFQPTATEDFYQNAVRTPYLREWEQVALPGLRESYAGDYYHADRQRREAEMARDLAIELGRRRSELEFQSQEAAKQRALTGAPIALNYASFIPSAQSDAISAYLGSVNPMLQALVEYLSRPLESRSSSTGGSTESTISASHQVSGFRPPGSQPSRSSGPYVAASGWETAPRWEMGNYVGDDIDLFNRSIPTYSWGR